MRINITARDFGGTEFSPSPTGCIWAHRKPRRGLAGIQPAGAVGRVHRHPPHPARRRHAGRAAGAGRNRLRQRGPEFYRLGQRRVDAGRRQRQWLHRLHPARPVRRPRHPPHRGRGRRADPSVYEQFIARVMASANAAAEAAKRAPPARRTPGRAPARPLLLPSRPPPAPPWLPAMPSRPKPLLTVPPPMPPRRALC